MAMVIHDRMPRHSGVEGLFSLHRSRDPAHPSVEFLFPFPVELMMACA